MNWSKLKKETESRFCDSMKDRVKLYCTEYRNAESGKSWITLDGKIIAKCCTRSFWAVEFTEEMGGDISTVDNGKHDKLLTDYGEFRKEHISRACWDFLHKLSIEEALESENPLIQTLAILDKRLGKRRLRKIDKESLHPLPKRIYEERLAVI